MGENPAWRCRHTAMPGFDFMATDAERLTEIDTAITGILTTGQSYTIDGITYTRAGLGTLERMRREIVATIARSAGTKSVVRSVDLSGMGYS